MRHWIAAALVVGCVLGSSPASAALPQLASQLVAGSLAEPVFLTYAPGDAQRLFVLERVGRVRIIKNGVLLPVPFLNISSLVSAGAEAGMLGIAFHPNYAVNGFFYVRYNDLNGRTTVARYKVSASSPDVAVRTSAQIVLRMPQASYVHTGGWIEFGPDGYLYIGQGEGGTAESAQDITDNWMGKILRVNVNSDAFPADPLRNYAIPPSNPFVGVTGDDEIWAYGLRNPYRCAFDRETGDLWIADVGASAWEEVDFQPAATITARNYAWPCLEGSHCTAGDPCTCHLPGQSAPVYQYSHSTGCAIVGGRMYRGCAIPELRGFFFCADFCTHRIWALRYDGQQLTDFAQLQSQLAPGGGLSLDSISAFGEDAMGELYICDLDGEIYKIVTAVAPPDSDGDGIPDSCETGPAADLNHDGIVGGIDLGLLMGSWGPCHSACPADLDHDGAVNGTDLAILLRFWS